MTSSVDACASTKGVLCVSYSIVKNKFYSQALIPFLHAVVRGTATPVLNCQAILL